MVGGFENAFKKSNFKSNFTITPKNSGDSKPCVLNDYSL